MDTAAVQEIAQGRVWTGTDGLTNGLVDVLGGLSDAMRIAKERAGIGPYERVEVFQYPEPEFINLQALMPSPVGIDILEDPSVRHLKFRLEHNGVPMPVLPAEEWDATMLNLHKTKYD